MNEIIEHLVAKAGITPEQAEKAIAATKEFIVAKLPPQFAPMVENFFPASTVTATEAASAPNSGETDWMDMAKNAIGGAGASGFTGEALNKLEGMFGSHE